MTPKLTYQLEKCYASIEDTTAQLNVTPNLVLTHNQLKKVMSWDSRWLHSRIPKHISKSSITVYSSMEENESIVTSKIVSIGYTALGEQIKIFKINVSMHYTFPPIPGKMCKPSLLLPYCSSNNCLASNSLERLHSKEASPMFCTILYYSILLPFHLLLTRPMA